MRNKKGTEHFRSASFTVGAILILGFAAVIFFVGWTQIRVKTNNVGVVISKISGISDKPVVSGKFSWHWEFLIPKNAELRVFETRPYSFNKKITGTLPSGEVYKAAYAGQPDFSYNFDFDITVLINPHDIIELLKAQKFSDQASMEKYIENSVDDVARLAANNFLKKASVDMFYRPETVVTEDIIYLTGAKKVFPNLDFQNFCVTNAQFPDFKLYQSVRSRYIEQLSTSVLNTMQIVNTEQNENKTENTENSSSENLELKNESDNTTEKTKNETEELLEKVENFIN